MKNYNVAGYTIIKNHKIKLTPFYDAIYQCLGNVDEFYIFYENRKNENAHNLSKKFVNAISPFYKIKMYPLNIDWETHNADFEAQKEIAKFLKQKYDLAIFNPANEFLPTGLKPALLEYAKKGESICFDVIKIWKEKYIIDENTYARFFKLNDIINAHTDNFNTKTKGLIKHPEKIHYFTSLFSQKKDLKDIHDHKIRNFPIRIREHLAVRYSKQYGEYPFEYALKEIIEDCEHKKNNKNKLEVSISYTKGYEESMKVSLNWTETYGVTESLIKKFNIKNAAEIGVARGHHSAHLLEAIADLHLYSVDPWGIFANEYDNMCKHALSEDEKLYQKVCDILKPFGNRSTILRYTSERAVQFIKEPLDMVYFDADHSYEGTKNDIGIWWDKVRQGGIISGRDYKHSSFPGIDKAVDEYLETKGLKPELEIGRVWWIKKPEEILSYIIPSCRDQKSVKETLCSIYKQNININFEIIICADKPDRDIQKLVQNHHEIKLFFNEENKNEAAKKNYAVSKSNGNLIYMLKSGDLLKENNTRKLIYTINRKGAAAASCREKYIPEENRKHIYKYIDDLFTVKEFITYPDSPAFNDNLMFTKAAYEKSGGYPERDPRENAGFMLRILSTGMKIAIAPGTKYCQNIIQGAKREEDFCRKANLNMAENFREFINLFGKKTQKLLLSENANIEADSYIKNKYLKLSDKGWDMAGGKKRYRNKLLVKLSNFKIYLIIKIKNILKSMYLKIRSFVGDKNVKKIKKIINFKK